MLYLPIFERKEKRTVLVHVSLNAKELLFPTLYSYRYSANKTSVWF